MHFFYFTDISRKDIKILSNLFYVILLPSIKLFLLFSIKTTQKNKKMSNTQALSKTGTHEG
jgi:hypothetical protein